MRNDIVSTPNSLDSSIFIKGLEVNGISYSKEQGFRGEIVKTPLKVYVKNTMENSVQTPISSIQYQNVTIRKKGRKQYYG